MPSRTESMHYTKQQVEDCLRDALQLVDEVDPPEDLRIVSFGKAVEMLSAKQIVYEQVGMPPVLPAFPGH